MMAIIYRVVDMLPYFLLGTAIAALTIFGQLSTEALIEPSTHLFLGSVTGLFLLIWNILAIKGRPPIASIDKATYLAIAEAFLLPTGVTSQWITIICQTALAILYVTQGLTGAGVLMGLAGFSHLMLYTSWRSALIRHHIDTRKE